MLFYLDNSLLDSLHDETKKLITISAIHRLLEAWVSGFHLLSAEPELLTEMIEGGFFQGQDIVNLRMLYRRLIQKYEYLQKFKFFVKVVKPDQNMGIFSINGRSYIQINANDVANSRVTLPAKLLVEDENDGEFYRRIGEVYLNNIHSEYLLMVDITPGGGANTYKSYRRLQCENEVLCLCVVDSDKSFPSDEIGGTAKNISSVHNKNVNKGIGFLCSYHFIDACEIENIIPTTYLIEMSSKNRTCNEFIEFIIFLDEQSPESRLYLDIKKGFFIEDYLYGNPLRTEYWKNALKNKNNSCVFTISGNCINHRNCFFELQGLGVNVLTKVNEIIEKIPSRKLYESCISNEKIRFIWDKLGEEMFCWFCSDKARYIS